MITAAKARGYAKISQLLAKTLDVSFKRRDQASIMALKWSGLADGIDRDDAKLANTATRLKETTMPTVKVCASAILGEFEKAQSELVGKAVILTDGKAGAVDNVWLDELHGLRISIKGHDGKWPVSTIKFVQDSTI